jgi:hypothetical protein
MPEKISSDVLIKETIEKAEKQLLFNVQEIRGELAMIEQLALEKSEECLIQIINLINLLSKTESYKHQLIYTSIIGRFSEIYKSEQIKQKLYDLSDNLVNGSEFYMDMLLQCNFGISAPNSEGDFTEPTEAIWKEIS